MKRYRFVLFIALWLAFTLMACQPEEVVETPTPVPPTPTVTPQALQQLGVSEVIVDSMEELKAGQEIVLVDISSLVSGKTVEDPEYNIHNQVKSIAAVDPVVMKLPLQPHGETFDLNINGKDDPGFQLYALQVRDALAEKAPFAGEYASLELPPMAGLSLQFDPENVMNIQSGWMLVWAADNQQLFPAGSGSDGILFTADDPLQPLDLGYTAILYEDGAISRFRESSTRVVFSTHSVPLTFDLSGQDAASAYEEALSVLEKYYTGWNEESHSAVQDIKSGYIDEDMRFSALAATLQDDLVQYHPQGYKYDWLKALYPADYGMFININADQEIRAYEIRLNSSADEAGLEYGDEIIKVNGKPVLEAIDEVDINAFSTGNETLQQKLKAFLLFRGKAGQETEITILSLKGKTKTLTLTAENNSSWLLNGLNEIVGNGISVSVPVVYDTNKDYGYIKINDFDEDPQLTRNMFVDSLEKIIEKKLNYLILDYRQASGSQFLELAGSFTDQDLAVGSLNCLEDFTQPVIVHPAEKKFEFKGIAVLTGEACSGACELEVLAMQQLDGVTTYGVNPSAGSMNVGPQASILLPNNGEIAFPVCHFTSQYLNGKSEIMPQLTLTNSYFAAIAKDDLFIEEAFADLLLRNKVVGEPEEKLQARTFAEISNLIYGSASPDYTLDYRMLEMMNFHDIQHMDLYDVLHEDDDVHVMSLYLCSADYQTKVENNDKATVSVFMDGQALTDYEMAANNFEANDSYGRYEEQPCKGWMVSFQKLIPGHHEVLVTIDAKEPVYYEDTYFEPGIYEVDLHFLVMDKEAEEKPNEQ